MVTRNDSQIDSLVRLFRATGTSYKLQEFMFAVDREGKTHHLRRLDYYNQTLLEQLHLGEGEQPDLLISQQFAVDRVPKYWPAVLPDVPPSEKLLQLLEND